VKTRWEKLARAPRLLEGVQEKLFTFDADGAAEEHTT